jgi:hypothetical protein
VIRQSRPTGHDFREFSVPFFRISPFFSPYLWKTLSSTGFPRKFES